MENYPSVPWLDAIKLVIEYLLVTLVLVFLFYLIFKSSQKAIVFSFFLMCLQFFFGAIHDFLKNSFPHLFISKFSFILPSIFVIIGILFFFLLKTNRSFKKMTRYFSLTLIVLIIIDTSLLIVKVFNTTQVDERVGGFIDCHDCKKPNIYLIITDEYAGRNELKDIFSFDNSSFDKELRKRNFHVVKYPSSNYNYTPYSMASIFSMNYLDGITNKGNDISNRNISYKNINRNKLTKILTTLGYDFVNLSMFDFAGRPSKVNNNEFYSTREKLISSQTFTGRIKKDLSFHLISTFKFQWAQKNLQQEFVRSLQKENNTTRLIAGEKSKQPRFIYTHFIMPHYPYLFDKNGNRLSFEESMRAARKDLYLGYLQYCNKQCLSLIDIILKKDETKPIIILMSDHGFTKYDSSVNPSYNFKNMINIYFPDNNYAAIPDTLSNVNLFRIVLNRQFKQKLPLLKDSTIFLKEY
jgi:hypothetical protein